MEIRNTISAFWSFKFTIRADGENNLTSTVLLTHWTS